VLSRGDAKAIDDDANWTTVMCHSEREIGN